jgi:long-chain acyl-CoA synthetase
MKRQELGIHSTIIRPCYIVADSQTGVCNTNDFIYKFIYQCIINKIAPKGIYFNLTPVNKVAKGIVNFMHSHIIINFIPSKPISTNELFIFFFLMKNIINMWNYFLKRNR